MSYCPLCNTLITSTSITDHSVCENGHNIPENFTLSESSNNVQLALKINACDEKELSDQLYDILLHKLTKMTGPKNHKSPFAVIKQLLIATSLGRSMTDAGFDIRDELDLLIAGVKADVREARMSILRLERERKLNSETK